MSTLKDITQTLIESGPADYKAMYDSVHALHDLFSRHSGIHAGNITDKHILLPSGKAISSIAAAHCLLEFKRTKLFLRGILKAIFSLQEKFPGERIHILYAGCGPYAALLTPLISLFSSKEIAFHLLDINPASLAGVKQMYASMNLKNYVDEYILHDATTYKIPESRPVHLIISETMLNALDNEPQVAIMQNLIPQLPEGGLFIPQNIVITARLVNGKSEIASLLQENCLPQRIELGKVYNIGQDSCQAHQKTSFVIPEHDEDCSTIKLFTDIQVFEDEILTTNDCSLNLSKKICEVKPGVEKQISFLYRMGSRPGFEYETG